MGDRLSGRVVLVMGAGSTGGVSNGQAAAITFAREGARVAAVDLDPQAAERTVHTIREEGGEAVAITADVTDGDEVERAVRTTRRFTCSGGWRARAGLDPGVDAVGARRCSGTGAH